MEVTEEAYVEHFGVKGMRWGVRRSAEELGHIPRGTLKDASRDAKEFARAKMYYGEGAGTRRKLIKTLVEDRSKRDAAYAEAFDHFLGQQDMGQHVSKAQTERSRTDRKNTAKKGAGAVARRVTGEMGTTAAFVAVAAGGAAYLNSPQGRRFMDTSLNKARGLVDNAQRMKNARNIRNIPGFG
jgi:hypothetical protein